MTNNLKLRDVWATQLDQDASTARIDVLPWLSRMTLDVIGHAGSSIVPPLVNSVTDWEIEVSTINLTHLPESQMS